MSTGRLKASQNRVRTSTTLQGNSMWTNTIGAVDPQAGTNSVIEAAINAPQFGTGRAARRAAAQEAVAQTGAFDSSVGSYESLLALARSQGAVGGANRGACKKCGQLGHLTKQCRNDLSKFFDRKPGGHDPAGAPPLGLAAAMEGGRDGGGGAAPSSDSGSSLSLSSDSSDSSGEAQRRRRQEKERKRKRKESSERKKKKRSKHKKDEKRRKA